MQSAKHRIILDTNLWISFLLSRDFTKYDALLLGAKSTLLFSEELLGEFLDVTSRPKLKRYFELSDVNALLLAITQIAEFVSVTSIVNECRDEKDNFLLALSKDGRATHLLTGDKDLLDLKQFGETQIMTISQYFQEHSQG
jgi:uncharacterized protein